jgi:hypothetical protein
MSETPTNRPVWRRQFLLEAGEAMLVTRDPVRNLINHVSAAKAIGVPQSELVQSRMSPMPIPVNACRVEGNSTRRRIDGVDPQMMWLPVLWLPVRLTERSQFQLIDGDLVVIDPKGHYRGDPRVVASPIEGVPVNTETSDAWVIRVALELETAGVYDVESGSWLDVLDTVGINVDDIDDVARVERWLEGGADGDLDWLEENFLDDGWHVPTGEGPTWALRSAIGAYPDLLDATWALSSDSMLNIVSDVAQSVDQGEIADSTDAKFITNMVCMLSGTLLRYYSNDEAQWWSEMSRTVEAFQGSTNDLVTGPLSEIDGRLTRVREECWPKMEALQPNSPAPQTSL